MLYLSNIVILIPCNCTGYPYSFYKTTVVLNMYAFSSFNINNRQPWTLTNYLAACYIRCKSLCLPEAEIRPQSHCLRAVRSSLTRSMLIQEYTGRFHANTQKRSERSAVQASSLARVWLPVSLIYCFQSPPLVLPYTLV